MIGILTSNPRIAHLLSTILERAGHVAIAATDPTSAVDLCQLQPEVLVVDTIARDTCWDIVVSDAVRTCATAPSLLVLAAWAEDTVASGGVQVLAFPFHADEVTTALEQLLRDRRAA